MTVDINHSNSYFVNFNQIKKRNFFWEGLKTEIIKSLPRTITTRTTKNIRKINFEMYPTCWGASFSETSHSISDSCGRRNWLKWPNKLSATFSAETFDSQVVGSICNWLLDTSMGGDCGTECNEPRRLSELLLRLCPWVATLEREVTEIGVLSLLEEEKGRETRRERTRFNRANFFDFRRSFSIATQNEVKETPTNSQFSLLRSFWNLFFFLVTRIFETFLRLECNQVI